MTDRRTFRLTSALIVSAFAVTVVSPAGSAWGATPLSLAGVSTPAVSEEITPPENSRIITVDSSYVDISEIEAHVGDDAVALDEFSTILAPLDDTTAEMLDALPGVTIEDDAVFTIGASQANAPWNLSRLDQRYLPVDSDYRYPAQAGTGVRVYVIDSGITPNAQFGNRLLVGASAVSDGRGTSDCNGHGTHVAGTVGSSSWGVAKSSLLIPVRVFDCNNAANLSTILSALNWILETHPPGTPGVINMSLSGPRNGQLDQAIAEVTAAGFIVVAAAGNASRDACLESPGGAASALTVGSSTIEDARSPFSNFGACLDIFAPGTQILSVKNDGTSAPALMSGTSMAAPHVAGVAALIWSTNSAQTARSVENALLGQAFVGALSGVGAGSPNRLLSSVKVDVASLPGTVTNIRVTSTTSTSVSLAWTAAPTTGAAITDYAIQYRRSGTTSWLMANDGISPSTTSTVAGLTTGARYELRVRGVTDAGNGPFSAPVMGTPGVAPSSTSSGSSALSAVYRFWSDEKQTHFYTSSAAERDHIRRTYPERVWKYEGVGFGAYVSPSAAPGTVPVYRFWSESGQSHFYTASAGERDFVIRTYPEIVWKYEGIAFYVFPANSSSAGLRPVSRFWSPAYQNHFYTASASESSFVRTNYAQSVWTYEGIAFRVPTATPAAAPLR